MHRALAAEGVVLWHDAALVVRQGRSAGPRRSCASGCATAARTGAARRGTSRARATSPGVLAARSCRSCSCARLLARSFARRRLARPAVLALPWLLAFDVAWARGEALRAPRRAARPMSAPELSVVVASVNGLPYLGRCLEALDAHAPEAEVVVADWTDEATRELVQRALAGRAAALVRRADGGARAAGGRDRRRHGARTSR